MKKKLALIFAILVLSQTLFSCSDTSEDTTLSETASSMAETGGTAGEESAETIAEEELRRGNVHHCLSELARVQLLLLRERIYGRCNERCYIQPQVEGRGRDKNYFD